MKITQAVFGTFHHFDLARELESRGHLQTIYSTFPWKRLQREGVSRDRVKTFPWIHTPEFVLARAKLLPRWLRAELSYRNTLLFDEYLDRQIEHCDALVAIAAAGLKTGRRLQAQGAKFICDRGSTHSRFQERIVSEEQRRWGVETPVTDIRSTLREEKIYEMCDAITVPASFARQSYIDLGLPAEKVHVIPYGVRLESFSPTHTPPDDRFEVLFVGGVTTRKGLPYLLQAFSRLRHPAKRLRIVGGMPNWMKPVLDRLPMENVELLGIVPQAELPAIMSGSHAMVLPSIEEGLALVQGQALACGCPVIATPNTGSEDLFSNDVEGFIVPMRDVDALLDRLQRLVDDPALQSRMRQAALDRVKHLGGWKTYGDKWEKLLKELTGAV
jgi:glycosyltransferase involved in cell wall biosynthesis